MGLSSIWIDLVLDLVYNDSSDLKMKQKVNIHEAKTHFSKLIARVLDGEEIIIAKAGKAVARLVPVKRAPAQRKPGSAKGKIIIAPDFNEPLPESMLKGFEQ